MVNGGGYAHFRRARSCRGVVAFQTGFLEGSGARWVWRRAGELRLKSRRCHALKTLKEDNMRELTLAETAEVSGGELRLDPVTVTGTPPGGNSGSGIPWTTGLNSSNPYSGNSWERDIDAMDAREDALDAYYDEYGHYPGEGPGEDPRVLDTVVTTGVALNDDNIQTVQHGPNGDWSFNQLLEYSQSDDLGLSYFAWQELWDMRNAERDAERELNADDPQAFEPPACQSEYDAWQSKQAQNLADLNKDGHLSAGNYHLEQILANSYALCVGGQYN